MLRGLLLALVALTLIAPAALPPAAFAADDEIFVDPGSPSGKEYALPVHRARQQAAGDQQSSDGASSAPLFGEGVNAARSGSAGGRSGRGADASDASAGSSDAGASGEGGAAAPQAAPRTLKAQAAAPDGGIGVAAIIGGVSVGVLLLGAAIGVLLRRRASRPA